MNNVSRLRREGAVYMKQLSDSGYKTMLRPEQKGLGLLEDIICSSAGPGDLVLDVCYGTNETGQACLLFSQICRFVECEKDQNCVAEALQSLAETFSRQLLNNDSDWIAPENILSFAKILVDTLNGNAAVKRAQVWAVPKKPALAQTFQKNIRPFPSIYYKNGGLFKEFRNILYPDASVEAEVAWMCILSECGLISLPKTWCSHCNDYEVTDSTTFCRVRVVCSKKL